MVNIFDGKTEKLPEGHNVLAVKNLIKKIKKKSNSMSSAAVAGSFVC
jgi:hypothetical protein